MTRFMNAAFCDLSTELLRRGACLRWLRATALLLGLLTAGLVAVPETQAFDFRKPIDINKEKVGTATAPTTLTNYPMLYSVTDAALITSPTGKVQSVNGWDIIFRAFDADNPGDNICGAGVANCTLDHEIETYVAATGQLIAWVRIPVLRTQTSPNPSTRIWIYYGDSGVSASTENKIGVWDTNFKGVWHLKETSGTVSDSTTNANTGTPTNAPTLGVAGQIGNATKFDGVNAYINMPDSASLDITGPITLEGWIRADTNQGSMDSPVTVIDKLNAATGGYSLFISSGVSTNNQLQMTTQNGATPDSMASPSYTFTESTFQHVVGVWSPSDGNAGTMEEFIYINGTQVASGSAANSAISNVTTALNLGGQTTNRSWNGALDEVRVSAVARDQDWIRTEFNNLDGPGIIGAPNWSDVGGAGVAGSGPPGVNAVAVYNDELYIGGQFTSVNGLAACQNLCRWNATNGWRAVGTYTTGITAGGVNSLAVYNGQLYVGGFYQNAAGIALCDRLCRWNSTTSTWSSIGGAQFNGNSSAVRALAVYNGELYAGGDFTKIGTNTAMANFAKFKDSTSTWSAVGSPALNGTVYALAVYKGELYVGGLFTTAGGAVADRIMKWNGSAYSIVGSTTPLNLNPTALGVYNNELYIGGQFTNAAGITGANSIAKWNGTTWSIVGSPSALANNVQALAAYCGDLYVGGTFTTAAGIPGADRIVKWDGTNYSIVGGATAISSFVNALGAYKGSLYVGGIFTSAGGNTNANGIAEWVGKCFYTVGTQEGPNAPSLARLTQAHALSHDGASTRVVELHWRTSFEADHLGFHVYREEQGQRTRITPALIAGSALKGHTGTVLTAGQSYSWWDVLPLKNGSLRYWLEELDLKGRRTWHGPIDVKSAKGSRLAAQPERVRSVLLTRLGRGHASVTAAPWYGPREAATALPTEEQLAVQWKLAASVALKLGVQAEGWYRVSQSELVAAGFDPRVDPRRLQLYADGVEVPLLVIGEQDGRFGPLDAIEFYGLGLDTSWTDTRTYWLVAGSQAGKRVGWVPSRQTGALAPLSFPQTLDWRPRLDYWAAILNGEADNFFGPLVSTEPVDQDLLVTQLDPAAPGEARLEVTLQGVTDVPHHVVVQLNGRPVGTVTWSGQTPGTTTISLPQAYLQAGANRLTLVADGGDMDYSVVTVVRLTYWHLYQAEGDVLEAAAHGGDEVTIRGFSSAQIRVVDVTQPDAVLAVEGRVKRDRSGYAVTVIAPGSGNRTLLAFTEGRQARAASIQVNHPSQWHVSGHGADLVILTHASLLPSLVNLKLWRETQGWAVALIDVQDLYDEFNFGAKSPWALRAFLKQAHSQWARPPRFLLLAGDASFDPRNLLGMGDMDLVPTKLVDTLYLETASDDWFGDLDEDGVPEIAVGRLAVQTSEQAAAVVQKLIAYDRAGAGGHATVLVADHDAGFDFEGASDQVKALLPADATVQEIYRGQTDDAAAHAAVLASLQQGAWLLNYVGHGSVEVWLGGVLSSEDVRALPTTGRLPFVVAMTCLNGFFHDIWSESLGETLQKDPQGGAIAVWASSALTEPAAQAPMNQALVRKLGEGMTVGEAAAQAKAAASDRDVRRSWILFGDPTTRLR